MSVGKYDPSTDPPPPLSHLQSEALHIAPFSFDRALEHHNLDDYSDASVGFNAGSEETENAEKIDEGKEEVITASSHTELESSSPSELILIYPCRFQIFNSLRDERRKRLREQYAPVNQADNHDASSKNCKQQPIMPTSTNENRDIHYSPHYQRHSNHIADCHK
ncbi:hypothetical protein FCULG_00012105 [Fusarium culmorum]|uniref:Uncharacterized protein n=1 Tax=Fusarium culmorum TaxID=5516 RepID=A0A2T4GF83_FUSCU|nr:hypothetical protein FCULG_00012105 [Fusarium culmorum]